ncbi:WW domain-binding protein 11-like [Antechinus flavipes]|uniref:WW domain-binding protein 11-like n=1 Tax=Antechinus flavipes TaxID=38775 RepID=UPI002235E7EA|nr:WW domain-binding protein 11-like [Antechinus flavipes]
MERRFASPTKSGKFMNPTDQARKEARKRELKKNKKQRMMVRAAVLKMKDPQKIIWDMEKLDEMEFNPVQQPQLHENVIKRKRKKLQETFQRIVRLYEKENPGIAKELGKLEVQCEQKRAQLSQYFAAVKKAQDVEVESIPLPDMPHVPSNISLQGIPLPGAQSLTVLKNLSAYGPPTRAISLLPLPGHGVPPLPPGRIPPGPPPGPPPFQVLQMYGHKVGFALEVVPPQQQEDSPELAQGGCDDNAFSTLEKEDCPQDMDQDKHDDSSCDRNINKSDVSWEEEFMADNEERENSEEKNSVLNVRFAGVPGELGKKKKNMKQITPLQATMLRIAGQEIPEEGQEAQVFSEDDDQEDSEDLKDTREQQHKEVSLPDGTFSSPAFQKQQPPPQSVLPAQRQLPAIPGLHPVPPLLPAPGLPAGPPPRATPFLKPLGMPGFRAPSPKLLLSGPSPQGGPPRLCPPAPLASPPPPPGRTNPPFAPQIGPAPPGLFLPAPLPNAQILSPPPNLIQRPKMHDTTAGPIEKKVTAIISAKPQITNPKVEMIRFVPTALRIQRENKRATAAVPQRKSEKDFTIPLAKTVPQSGPSAPVSVQTKDDVYKAFMKEMEGLL